MKGKEPVKLRVAIVEDEPLDVDLLRRNLNRIGGISITGVHATAEEALKAIPRTPPDVVLMDIHLPHMSGIECARALKRVLPRLRILALTCDDTRAVLDAALKSGMDGYLVKPVRKARLIAALSMVCAGQFPLSHAMISPLVEIARHPSAFTPHPLLTRRENEIMAQVVLGGTDKDLAAHFGVAVSTICRHLHNIYIKLGVHTRTEAVHTVCESRP